MEIFHPFADLDLRAKCQTDNRANPIPTNRMLLGGGTPGGALRMVNWKLGPKKEALLGAGPDGSLSSVIARTLSFDEMVEAHRFIEAGKQIGKIVLAV